MAVLYLISGIVFLLIALILFTNSLQLGEKKNRTNRDRENSTFAKSLILLIVGLVLIFLYIISKSFKN